MQPDKENSARKREVLGHQARLMVFSVLQFFRAEKKAKCLLVDIKQLHRRTARACGVSRTLVQSIVSEVKRQRQQQPLQPLQPMPYQHAATPTAAPTTAAAQQAPTPLQPQFSTPETSTEPPKFSTPNKIRKKKQSVCDVDSFDIAAIRNLIQSFISKKVRPTLQKLLKSLQNTGILVNRSRESLRRLLVNSMGFHFERYNGRKTLMERTEIALWRCRFLRATRHLDWSKMIFIDETWANANDCHQKGWTDRTLKGSMNNPIGKGSRIIVCHAGGANGWIPTPPLIFKSKKTTDYHEEMNAAVFEEWFEEVLLPNIPAGSDIVMDNASYHSRQLDKAPTSNTLKPDIVAWLLRHDIREDEYGNKIETLLKIELLDLVKRKKPRFPSYYIDNLALQHGHRVIRLPPYHCHFNPIELAWAQVKFYVKEHNQARNLTTVQQLFEEGVNSVTPSAWAKLVDHVKQAVIKQWEDDGLQERAIGQFVISLADSDPDSDDNSEGHDIDGVVNDIADEDGWDESNELVDYEGGGVDDPANDGVGLMDESEGGLTDESHNGSGWDWNHLAVDADDEGEDFLLQRALFPAAYKRQDSSDLGVQLLPSVC
ncbi:hypothetical protein FOCC_FOCC013208 [Frankliniella occidentalis]|nr:hypothetical protein FOCC_FOCC013208 [Frankliniella occidentalis]